MKSRLMGLGLLVVGCAYAAGATPAAACPFCSAMSETLSEQIGNMDAAIIARLLEAPPLDTGARTVPPAKSAAKGKFKLVHAVKGEPLLGGSTVVETLYFGDAQKNLGQSFLLLGIDPPKLMWSAPMLLSERACDYVRQLPSLPKEGPERLAFFQRYLEDSDETLARDAYEEFARAPYDVVKGLRDQMNRPQLVAWIRDSAVPVSRRRLYLTMLGVCGSQEDLPLLETLLRSTDRSVRSGLDALIACYLTLAGPQGMPLIEDLFLKDANAEYSDTYAAIMALRFHGTESEAIPRPDLLAGLRCVLDRPQLADLVIPDLARWEDWSVMPQLVQLFKTADAKSTLGASARRQLLACLPADPRPRSTWLNWRKSTPRR